MNTRGCRAHSGAPGRGQASGKSCAVTATSVAVSFGVAVALSTTFFVALIVHLKPQLANRHAMALCRQPHQKTDFGFFA